MKSILFAILTLLLTAPACKTKSSTQKSEVEEANVDTVVVVMENPKEKGDSLAIYFEKTPCFGRCPAFKVRIYDSGFATYEGINFAERMGLYSYRFTQNEIKNIVERAEDINYFELEETYDDPRITDLPSTISEISYGDKSHRVKARIDIPKPLKDFHENLAVTLTEKDWKPYSLR